MLLIPQDPRAAVYQKYVLEYLRDLMSSVLNNAEETVILLHCGIHTGDPVDFSEIAKLLQLNSAKGAEELYCQAIRKTRAAIPGSRLENWIIGYRLAYHPQRREEIYIDPNGPVPRWT